MMDTSPHRTIPVQRYAMLAAAVVGFATAAEIMLITPLLTEINQSLRTNLVALSVTVYAIAAGTSGVLVGTYVHRFRKPRLIWIFFVLFALACFVMAGSPNLTIFMIARAVSGMSSGILSLSLVTWLADLFPYEERGRPMGVLVAGRFAGTTFGIPAVSFVAARWESLGWRAPYLLIGIFTLAMCFLGLLMRSAVRSSHIHEADPVSSAGFWASMKRVVSKRDRLAALVAVTLYSGGLTATVVYLGAWLGHSLNAGPEQVGLLFLAGGGAAAFGSLVAGRLSDRTGKKILTVGSTVALVPVIASFTLLSHSIPVVMAVFFVAYLLVSMRDGPYQALITSLAGPELRGALIGARNALAQVGIGVATAAATWLYQSKGISSYPAITFGGAALILASALIIGAFVKEGGE